MRARSILKKLELQNEIILEIHGEEAEILVSPNRVIEFYARHPN